MNQSHVIDSWIAELGLSSRRLRRGQEPQLRQASGNSAAAASGLTEPAAAGSVPRRPHARPRPYQAACSAC